MRGAGLDGITMNGGMISIQCGDTVHLQSGSICRATSPPFRQDLFTSDNGILVWWEWRFHGAFAKRSHTLILPLQLNAVKEVWRKGYQVYPPEVTQMALFID